MPHASLAALRCRADSHIAAYGSVAFTVIVAIAALSTTTEVHVFFRWNNSIVCFRAFRRHRGRHQPARATPFAVRRLPFATCHGSLQLLLLCRLPARGQPIRIRNVSQNGAATLRNDAAVSDTATGPRVHGLTGKCLHTCGSMQKSRELRCNVNFSLDIFSCDLRGAVGARVLKCWQEAAAELAGWMADPLRLSCLLTNCCHLFMPHAAALR